MGIIGCALGVEEETALLELLLDPLEPEPSLEVLVPGVIRESPLMESSFSSFVETTVIGLGIVLVE